MGTWGPEILSNDLAEDIKETWLKRLGEGDSPVEITISIIEDQNLKGTLGDNDENYTFWLSFALIQWETGRLQDDVRKNALSLLNPTSIENNEKDKWLKKTDYKNRISELEKLKTTLQSTQPKARKITKPFHRKSILKKGDVITIKLKSYDFIIIEIIEITNDQEDQIPRGIIYDYLSKEKPTLKTLAKLKPLVIRKIYNDCNTRVINGKVLKEYSNEFYSQFTLWAKSKRFDEPRDRIEFLERNKVSSIIPDSGAIYLEWKEIDETPLKWLKGDIEIYKLEKEL